MLSFTACATHCRGRIGSAGTWPGRFGPGPTLSLRQCSCGCGRSVRQPRLASRLGPASTANRPQRGTLVSRLSSESNASSSAVCGRPSRAPAVRHFRAATALAIRSRISTSSGPCRRSAAMNPPRNASPAPVVSTHGTLKAGVRISRPPQRARLPRGPSVTHVSAGCSSAWSRSRARPVSEDAVQRSGNPSDAITMSMSGSRRSRPGRYSFHVDRGNHSGIPRNGCRSNGRLDVVAVHEQDPRGAHGGCGNIRRGEGEARVAVPEHRAVTSASVHDDHREARLRTRHDFGRAHVHAFGHEAVAPDVTELVRPESSEVPGAPSEPRAADHRRGDLSTWKPCEALDLLLRVARRELAQERDEVDAVLSETRHVA